MKDRSTLNRRHAFFGFIFSFGVVNRCLLIKNAVTRKATKAHIHMTLIKLFI